MAWEQLAPQVITRLSRDLQLTPQQAAGIVGQLGHESDGLQAINEYQPAVPGSRGGFGWAQWTGPRRKQFEAFAADRQMDVTDPEANYQYLVHELTNTPESRVVDRLRASPDAQAAGRVFTDQFLRPGVPAYDSRASWTERALNAIIPSAQAGTLPAPDASSIVWDDAPQGGQIDVGSITWDDAQPATGEPMRIDMAHQGGAEPGAQGQEQAWQQDSTLAALGAGIGAGVGQVALGAQRYLGKGLQAVGADSAGDWLVQDAEQGRDRLRQQLAPYKQESPIAVGGAELAGEIAATLPVGGVLARAVRAAAPAIGSFGGTANRLAESLSTAGLRVGATPQSGMAGNALLRMAGGGATGGISAGLVNQDDAGTGAAVGAAFPVVGRMLGAGAQSVGRALRGGEISEPVRALAARAADLGIQIPADRIANSRPLNAVASGLNYVPLSGRSAVEDRMQDQLNRAVTRTFGQDSTNVTQALRQASADLGQKFEDVLSSNGVRLDDQFLNDLVVASERAARELGAEQAGIIQRQIDEIVNKGASGVIEGKAAYNIKRTLDRIGKRSTPEGSYADDLRRDLMNALNRSLGEEAAQGFAQTRRQYSSMLSLERLAQNGAEGDISIARLANMRDIRNPELQELADIAAQFLRPRESQHSAAQRAFAGLTAGVFAGPAALSGGMLAGNVTNRLLDSQLGRNAIMSRPGQTAIDSSLNRLLPLTYRAAPVISAQ